MTGRCLAGLAFSGPPAAAVLLPLAAHAGAPASPGSGVSAGAMGPGPVTKVIVQAHAEALLPAPLPDPDIEGPAPGSQALEAQADPSLEPGIFNRQSHFSGNGYASGSSLETDQDHRSSVGGGVKLDIPVP